MKRQAYIYDPAVEIADARDLVRISQQLGAHPRMIPCNAMIKELVLEVIGTDHPTDVLLIPTRPEHCTPMIRKVQAIALQMDMEVMPVCSFLSRTAASTTGASSSQTAPGTDDAAPTTSTASVSGQPIPESACTSC